MSNVTPTPWPKDRLIPPSIWQRPEGVRLISSDDHVLEVPHLWEDRLKGADKDRAEILEGRDRLSYDGPRRVL